MAGYGAETREAHQANALKKELLQAMRAGKLTSEASLDLAASGASSSSSGIVDSPFLVATPEPQGGQASSQARKQRSKSSGSGSASILGEPAENVPAELHARMVAAVLEGKLPKTSLEQRLRNRPTARTLYSVPEDLQPALEHGYIHPNVAPPAGLVWRCAGGRWKLSVRGG